MKPREAEQCRSVFAAEVVARRQRILEVIRRDPDMTPATIRERWGISHRNARALVLEVRNGPRVRT